ncbi:MAG: DUF4125 family protein [Lachnospiraceae bacterium]|nr:DUF4125 family protein [Lachnospiraceae bacterium]
MNIADILQTYDEMFGKNTLEEIEEYLAGQITQAREQGELGVLFTLLNEMIGFCRDTTQREKGLDYCAQLLSLLEEMELEGRVEHATSLLNIANAYRAFDLHEQAFAFFEQVEENYQKHLEPGDFRYASLYNNWSLLYQEMGNQKNAVEMLRKALAIVALYEDAVIPKATSMANLAASLIVLATQESYEEAEAYLKEALQIYENDGGRDFHYGAALVAMGDLMMAKEDYVRASSYYEKGLLEVEKHTGINDNYKRVQEKCAFAKKKAEKSTDNVASCKTDVAEGAGVREFVRNIDRCRAFYETYGRPMIAEKFPEYESRIAVGMVGEGSDCYGYDDAISTDHDYGIGFCMWLMAEDWKRIGADLQKAYEELIESVYQIGKNDRLIANRRGVFTCNDFYNGLLGTQIDFESVDLSKEAFVEALRKAVFEQPGVKGERVQEMQLASAVNGAVFRDDLGVFTGIRNVLQGYYPDQVWREKLATELHEFSQYAQSNYPRMMAREDYVTASLCIAKAVEAAMNLAFLLSRTYAPYYKWKRKALEALPLGDKLLPILERVVELPLQKEAWLGVTYDSAKVHMKDAMVASFEQVAAVLLEEMKRQQLVEGQDLFLEGYISQIMDKIESMVDKIVALEWELFDKVENEGGRASCQDNWSTFQIMRKSQYQAWPKELLESFYKDLQEGKERGWNLITEKYARMMESTAPERFTQFQDSLPVRSPERIQIQEEIIKIQVQWMEAFAAQYPKMAIHARTIHTKDDTPYDTSYETYLRGEMSTYSEETLMLYGRFIVGLLQEGRNLAYEIMNNTARLYGYESVEDAESKI